MGELTKKQFDILYKVYENPEFTIEDLSRELFIDEEHVREALKHLTNKMCIRDRYKYHHKCLMPF